MDCSENRAPRPPPLRSPLPQPAFPPLEPLPGVGVEAQAQSLPVAIIPSGLDTLSLNPGCSPPWRLWWLQQEKELRPREVGGAELGGLLLGNSMPLRTELGSPRVCDFAVFCGSTETCLYHRHPSTPVLDPEIPPWNPEHPRLRGLQAGRGWNQESVHQNLLRGIPGQANQPHLVSD